MKNLKCFTEHMKIHNVTADKDTEMTLVIVRKTKHTDHTAICNTMKAETIAANLAKKEEERVARKVAKIAKKTNKDTPTNNHAQNPENTNEVEISDDPLDEGAESIPTTNAENVITQQQENILTTSTTEPDISGSDSEYDPDDSTNYEEDEIVEQEEVSEENICDNPQGIPEIEFRREAFKREFDEIDLTNSDDEDEIVEIIPVEKVKTMKRKLSFKVSDNIVKTNKRKNCFIVSDNIVKRSKGF